MKLTLFAACLAAVFAATAALKCYGVRAEHLKLCTVFAKAFDSCMTYATNS